MLKSSFTDHKIEAGCDEVGRGCLAGPVVAAAVILPKNFNLPLIDDSKKLVKKVRWQLEEEIKKVAIDYAIAEVSNIEIDKINILNASFLAMHLAIEKLKKLPEMLLIDGNRFKPYKTLEYQCIIKGDGKFASIAAASILAKNYRDRLMEDLSLKYPEYDWHQNVGYPTTTHRDAIKKHGVTPYHRKSFRLLPVQIELFND